MAHRERLERFYLKYNPDKMDEIDGVLQRYKGKETQLFTALVKKYGPEPAADEILAPRKSETKKPAAVTSAWAEKGDSKVVADFNHARLLAFYQKYNPDKVGEVDTMLARYKGKEAQLFNALVKKYGPEPDDSDDSDAEEEKPAAVKAVAAAEEEEDESDEDDEQEEQDGEPKLRQVQYCPIDTLPPEFCEYGPMFAECKPWLAEHCPTLYLQKYNRTVEDLLDVERQIAEGVEGLTLVVEGKTVKKKKKKKDEGKSKDDVVIQLSMSARKGKKRLTFVTGLDEIEGINMKDACKNLGKRFACSSSLSKTDTGKAQIQLQGDCITELQDVLAELYDLGEDQIVIVDEPKKQKKKQK